MSCRQRTIADALRYSQESKAEKSSSEKISLFRTFAEANRTVFLTTRDGSSGQLHARQMVPKVEKDLTHLFLYDKESHKHQEVKDDEHVNVAYDGGNQGWASVAGTGSPSQDKDLIKKVYNPSIKAWFADLGDGVRDGSENDPRIAILVVKPEEIRFYNQKKTLVGQAIDVAASAIGGGLATPGEILTITQEDVSFCDGQG